MKLTMVGSGRVGSTALFQFLLEGLFQEVVIVDIDRPRAEGEALDLLHGTALNHRCSFLAADYDATSGSDMVLITAGIPRRPGETRLDLLKKNVGLMGDILDQIMRYNSDPFIIMVSNPVDVLTYQAIRKVGLPPNKVFGTGTLLDTTRFRSMLGERLGVNPGQVHAYMLGEHGDSMAPILTGANVAGLALEKFPGFSQAMLDEVIEATRFGGARVIERKGGTFYSVAPMITELIRAILQDSRQVLPISSLMDGQFGMRDVSISLPCVIGANGREQVLEPPLSDSEREALLNSYNVLRGAIQEVGL